MPKDNQPHALEWLDEDHRRIEALFARYRELVQRRAPAAKRAALADRICMALTIHARLEQELLYPALREAGCGEDVVGDAEGEHESLREAAAQVLASNASEALYDAKVALLGESFARHLREERQVLFTCARRAGLDLGRMGALLAVRKEELCVVADALREDALVSFTA